MISEEVEPSLPAEDFPEFHEWLDEQAENEQAKNDPQLAPLFRWIFQDSCWPKRGSHLKGFTKHLLRKHEIGPGPIRDALHEAHRRYREARRRYRLARDAAREAEA